MELRLTKKVEWNDKLTERFPDSQEISGAGAWILGDSEYTLKSCLVRLKLYPDLRGKKQVDFIRNTGSTAFELKWNQKNGIYRYKLFRNGREDFQITFYLKSLSGPVSVFSVFSTFNPQIATDRHVKVGFDFLEKYLTGMTT